MLKRELLSVILELQNKNSAPLNLDVVCGEIKQNEKGIQKSMIRLDISFIQKEFYLPHVRILGTNHCGELCRTALKHRELFQDVLCRHDCAERLVAIFSNQIKS